MIAKIISFFAAFVEFPPVLRTLFHFFVATNITSKNCKFCFWTGKEICLSKTLRIIVLFTQKFVIKLSKIWIWDPRSGSGSRVKKAPDPGSATLLKFFVANPDPGSSVFLTLDTRWKILNPRSGITVRIQNTAGSSWSSPSFFAYCGLSYSYYLNIFFAICVSLLWRQCVKERRKSTNTLDLKCANVFRE